MIANRELHEGRALEQGSGILPGLKAMVARAEVSFSFPCDFFAKLILFSWLVVVASVQKMITE